LPNDSPSRIQLHIAPPVANVTLSNGPQNIIDFAMMDELTQAIGELEAALAISTILLTGSGANFSSGVDIPSHTPEKVGTMLSKFHEAIRRLACTSKVTIAVVRGNCLGGGAELALMCDIVLTAEDAKWGFPEIKLGCYPPVACTALAAVVGQKRAAELVLTGRTFNGQGAEQMGIANRSVQTAELDGAANEVLRELATLSPAALAHAKRALYAWDAMHFEKGLDRAEKLYLNELIQTEDAQEGIRAWIEKRSPRWQGK